jgi:hypothetical protein
MQQALGVAARRAQSFGLFEERLREAGTVVRSASGFVVVSASAHDRHGQAWNGRRQRRRYRGGAGREGI